MTLISRFGNWFLMRWRRDRVFILLAFFLLFVVIASWLLQHWSPVDLAKHVEEIASNLADVEEERRESTIRLILFNGLDSFEKGSFRDEVLKHLTLAALVALVLLLFVEIHTAHTTKRESEEYLKRLESEINIYKDQISQEVWSAIAQRQVPNPIVLELSRVLKADVALSGATYTITLGMPYHNVPKEFIVIKRELSYDLLNLTGQESFKHTLRSVLVSPYGDTTVQNEFGHDIIIPRFIEYVIIKEDGEEQPLDLGANERELYCEIPLSVGGGIKIYGATEELKKIEDKVIYGFLQPAVNFSVIVKNQTGEELDVIKHFFHPNFRAFRPQREGHHEYRGGVLPGQSFSLEWKRKVR